MSRKGDLLELELTVYANRLCRSTQEQVNFAHRQAESGRPVAEIVRKMRIRKQTF